MQVKTDKLTLQGALSPREDPSDVVDWTETDSSSALSEIVKIRGYLEQLKNEIYQAIDAGYEDVSCFNEIGNATTHHCFNQKPSIFFEAAYAMQTFDEQGSPLENRRQPFINAGEFLNEYFKNTNLATLDADQRFLNDAGKMIGAINSSLSQLNRVESHINQKNHTSASAGAGAISGCIQAIIESSREASFIKLVPNQTTIEKMLASLREGFESFKSFFKNINKSTNVIHKDQCEEMKSNYPPSPSR